MGTRIVYKDKFSFFENLLEKIKAVKINARNLQVLVTEMSKVKNGIAPNIINFPVLHITLEIKEIFFQAM